MARASPDFASPVSRGGNVVLIPEEELIVRVDKAPPTQAELPLLHSGRCAVQLHEESTHKHSHAYRQSTNTLMRAIRAVTALCHTCYIWPILPVAAEFRSQSCSRVNSADWALQWATCHADPAALTPSGHGKTHAHHDNRLLTSARHSKHTWTTTAQHSRPRDTSRSQPRPHEPRRSLPPSRGRTPRRTWCTPSG